MAKGVLDRSCFYQRLQNQQILCERSNTVNAGVEIQIPCRWRRLCRKVSSPSFRAESDLRPLITSHDEQLSLNKMWSISELGRGGCEKREGEKGDGGETWPWPKDNHQHLLKGRLVYVVNKGLMRDQ